MDNPVSKTNADRSKTLSFELYSSINSSVLSVPVPAGLGKSSVIRGAASPISAPGIVEEFLVLLLKLAIVTGGAAPGIQYTGGCGRPGEFWSITFCSEQFCKSPTTQLSMPSLYQTAFSGVGEILLSLAIFIDGAGELADEPQLIFFNSLKLVPFCCHSATAPFELLKLLKDKSAT